MLLAFLLITLLGIIYNNITYAVAIFALFWPYFFTSGIQTKIKHLIVRKDISTKKLNFSKYTGFKVFCVNTLMLLSIGSMYLLFEKLSTLVGLYWIILLVFFIILGGLIHIYYNWKGIKYTILKLYLNLKKNYRYILLNKLLLWISMRSTLILLWGFLNLLSPWFGEYLNIFYTLLSINLFAVILQPFSVNCMNWCGLLYREYGLNIACNISTPAVADWLIKNTQIKENQISTLDLCENNVRTLSQLFNIDKPSNEYAFIFGRKVYAVKADYVKFCEPIQERRVQIFYTEGTFEDQSRLRDYLYTLKEKTMGIYDPLSKNLYLPRVGGYEKYDIISNNIVYHRSEGNFVPYDPLVHPRVAHNQNKPLYIRDKEDNMHDLGLKAWTFRLRESSIPCAHYFYWIKCEAGKEPIIQQVSHTNKHYIGQVLSIKPSTKDSTDNIFISRNGF